MKNLKVLTILVMSICSFFSLAINAMENEKNQISQKDGIFGRGGLIKPERYDRAFRIKFGIRKGYYSEKDMGKFIEDYKIERAAASALPKRLIIAKDFIDKYLNEYLDYLLSILDNNVNNYKGKMKYFSMNKLYDNIREFPNKLKQKYGDFTEIYKDNEDYYDYIMENYIDDVLNIKYHFTVKESDEFDDDIIIGDLEDKILKDKINKVYEKLKVRLVQANLGIKQGLEDKYKNLKDVFEKSIKFDENLKKGYEIKSENNIRKTFENLFESRKVIADFFEVVNFEIGLLRQMRVLNPEHIEQFNEETKLNDYSDFINFMP